MTDKNTKHKNSMEKLKSKVDSHIAQATEERGILLLLTGDGKGKSSSAFGMVMRSLGYGHQVGIVQFIKGKQKSGEELFIQEHFPDVFFHQMGTGFTWNTQDREADIEAAEKTWEYALACLQNPDLRLVVLDELTYMIAYKYLDEAKVLTALENRPEHQTVVVTGRGGGSSLRTIADTVSEVNSIKHAFQAGIKAREGVDF